MTCVVHDKKPNMKKREGNLPKVCIWLAVLEAILHCSNLNGCYGNSCCEPKNSDKSRHSAFADGPGSSEKAFAAPRSLWVLAEKDCGREQKGEPVFAPSFIQPYHTSHNELYRC